MTVLYRSDIDGLRALAVLSVMLFHIDTNFLPGGFVGVDVFFVISGYLISSSIIESTKANNFSFIDFYKRRAARLLPSLSITLLLTLVLGFFLYGNQQFDSLAKDIFFSAIGFANIHFSQGVNYFAQDVHYRPLIHLWSLGVEEQFYIVWPAILLLIYKISKNLILPVTVLLFALSLLLSVNGVNRDYYPGYFLPHYRAFEFLCGCILAKTSPSSFFSKVCRSYGSVLSLAGFGIVILTMFLFDKDSNFPGYNALLVCIGTFLILAFPTKSKLSVTYFLSWQPLVWIGLISYPLYLFHQPLISFLLFIIPDFPATLLLLSVLSSSILMGWLTYRYIEVPVRITMKHGTRFKQRLLVCTFISITSFFVVSGLVVAKSGGLPARFQFLNPFAVEVDIAHKPSFHINFQRGYVVSERPHSRVLFVGDSVLQQFALPMTKALRISPEEADFVTRGGCVLLKGVDFIDKFSDISCNSLRDRLYNLDKRYDLVVISQQWDGYENSITNSPDTLSLTERWRGFLADTIIHFKHISDKVIIIGGHIKVAGTTGIQPSIRISRESLDKRLSRLRVDDLENTKKLDTFFSKLSKEYSIQAVKPLDIFCDNENCKLTDGKWSYFSDSQHISSASTEFVSAKLKKILASFE